MTCRGCGKDAEDGVCVACAEKQWTNLCKTCGLSCPLNYCLPCHLNFKVNRVCETCNIPSKTRWCQDCFQRKCARCATPCERTYCKDCFNLPTPCGGCGGWKRASAPCCLNCLQFKWFPCKACSTSTPLMFICLVCSNRSRPRCPCPVRYFYNGVRVEAKNCMDCNLKLYDATHKRCKNCHARNKYSRDVIETQTNFQIAKRDDHPNTGDDNHNNDQNVSDDNHRDDDNQSDDHDDNQSVGDDDNQNVADDNQNVDHQSDAVNVE